MTTDRIDPLRPAARAASLVRDAAPEIETPGFVATVGAPASARVGVGAVAASVRAPSEPPARPQSGARAASCAALG